MYLRDLINLPVFVLANAGIIGRVEKAIINDDYYLEYVVAAVPGQPLQMVRGDDFILTDNAVIIQNQDCMKSYICGEELSVYQLKTGDAVFDEKGRELGIVSDFIVNADKKVTKVEISAGLVGDMLNGRDTIILSDLAWKSDYSGMCRKEGNDLDG